MNLRPETPTVLNDVVVTLKLRLPQAWLRWPEAGLEDAMFYLRRSAALNLPPAFKALIPRTPEECNGFM